MKTEDEVELIRGKEGTHFRFIAMAGSRRKIFLLLAESFRCQHLIQR